MEWRAIDAKRFPNRKMKIIMSEIVGNELKGWPPVILPYDATSYRYTYLNDSALALDVVIEAFGDEQHSTKSDAVRINFKKITPAVVTNLKAVVGSGQVSLSWNVDGLLKDERPDYNVAIYIQSDYGVESAKPVVFETLNHGSVPDSGPELVLPLTIPRNYVVEVVAVVGIYSGPPSTANISVTEPMGPPVNVEVVFDSPTSVTISFTRPKQKNPDLMDKECQVDICPTKALSTKCSKNMVEAESSSVSTEVQHSTNYYTTIMCTTGHVNSSRSQWVFFNTPTHSKRTVPGKVHNVESGINIKFDVNDGINVVLVWEFSYDNGTKFLDSNVVEFVAAAYSKAKRDLDYKSEVVSDDAAKKTVDLGLSPSLLFGTGCHFYSLSVTFVGGYTSFVSSDETCYGLTSPSFIFFYALVIILLISGAVSLRMKQRRRKYILQRRRIGSSSISSSSRSIVRVPRSQMSAVQSNIRNRP